MNKIESKLRVEHKELHHKSIRLEAFIQGEEFEKLPIDEKERLTAQVYFMAKYCRILSERIAAIENINNTRVNNGV